MVGTGQTQQQVADELGWSRTQVADYASLKALDPKAWELVATSVRNGASPPDDAATEVVATATFSERLLRVLPPLSAEKRAPRLSPTYAAIKASDL